jgi:hypothetical protein
MLGVLIARVGAGFGGLRAFLRLGAGGPWARTGSRGSGGAGQARAVPAAG